MSSVVEFLRGWNTAVLHVDIIKETMNNIYDYLMTLPGVSLTSAPTTVWLQLNLTTEQRDGVQRYMNCSEELKQNYMRLSAMAPVMTFINAQVYDAVIAQRKCVNRLVNKIDELKKDLAEWESNKSEELKKEVIAKLQEQKTWLEDVLAEEKKELEQRVSDVDVFESRRTLIF